ncbi:MAG: glycosyltransferase [Actinomycetia bacterium]|nr:glycosyltransferase [Actinomycetes bacterium]
MIKVSIISLIYRSKRLADWVYESVHAFTPMIARGEAEFLFVANDPTVGLLKHLEERGYPHIVNINKHYSEAELFASRYGTPEYMSRVYRGYNEGIRAAQGDYVVLINSDNYFSPDWLENLLKYSDRGRVVTSTLVEREHPVFSVFPGAVHGEFGDTPDSFDEAAFLSFALRIRKTGLEPDGAYMPALMHRDVAIGAGLYPCGNVAGQSFDEVVRYGDEAFYDTLRSLGVEHVTALDSISYHLKEGERDDSSQPGDARVTTADELGLSETLITPYPIVPAIRGVADRLVPLPSHLEVTAFAGGKARSKSAMSRRVDSAAEVALHNKAERLRRGVEKVVGKRLAMPVLKAVHSVSWIVRPLRKKMVSRRLR